MKTSSRAFTLIEILVVVAIIGLLAGLLFTNTDKIFGQSQEVVAKVFVRDSLKTTLTRYRIDVGDYPSTADGLAALLTAPPPPLTAGAGLMPRCRATSSRWILGASPTSTVIPG